MQKKKIITGSAEHSFRNEDSLVRNSFEKHLHTFTESQLLYMYDIKDIKHTGNWQLISLIQVWQLKDLGT